MIRPVTEADAAAWEQMREELWPTTSGEHNREIGEHTAEISKYFAGDRREPAEVLIAFNDLGEAVGFVELSLRSIADGCYSSPVAYLEGWYVDESERGNGIGKELVRAGEEWGRGQGCTEFASDAEISNPRSIAIYKHLGFEETSRVVTFRKNL